MLKWLKNNIVELILGLVLGSVVATMLGVGIVLVISNENNEISEGIVVDRDYTAGYTTIGTNNSPPVYHPSRCTLTISGTKNGEEVEYTFEVPESEYVLYNIGDHYPKS